MTMGTIFLRVINMSITASWLMAAVIVLRLLLKKAPKWLICLFWVFVAVRLVCPFSVESTWSLVPSAEPVSERRTPVRDTPQNAPVFSTDMNEAEDGNTYAVGNGTNDMVSNATGAGSTQNNRLTGTKDVAAHTDVLGVVWICGVAGLLFYGLMSYAKLHKRTAVSAKVEGQIWQCDDIRTPFILGMLRPRIYLPSDLDEAQAEYVIAHERTHLKRRDHWWKPLGFFILTIHWFNPLCWVSYILLCRDIELACDERVIRSGDEQYKKSYAEALLACSIGSKTITVCPLAFGETSVKERVRNIMNYKKPAFWLVLTAAAACIAVAVCFLTNPQKKGELQTGRQEDADQQNRIEVQVQQGGNEHNANNAAGVGANGSNSSKSADDANSRLDNAGAETVNREDTQDLAAHDIPDVVWEQAKQYVQAAFDRTKEDYEQGIGLDNSYTEWRIDNLEYCYTYVWSVDRIFQIFRLNYEFLAESPKDVVLAGGMSISDDGWVVPESPNSNYLIFAKTEAGLSYFCGMYENDCEPGDEVFTWDLLRYCNEIGLFDESEDANPDGEELLRRFKEVDIEELHAIPYTQNITGDYTGVGADVTRADGSTCRAEILCIGELPDQGIRLYGYNDETYWRQGVAVEIGDDISYFDWEYMTPRIQFPKLYWNEGAKQLQITLPVYTGTSFAAEKLIVLQYNEKGVLEPNDFKLGEFSALISSVLDYRFDEESGMLTLIDRRTDREVGTAMLPGETVYGIEGGDISEFVLGDTIRLRVTPGYLTDAAVPQYDNMPVLEFEVDIMEMQGNRLSFLLGGLR